MNVEQKYTCGYYIIYVDSDCTVSNKSICLQLFFYLIRNYTSVKMNEDINFLFFDVAFSSNLYYLHVD